jgi:hypothetical protein
MAKKMVIIAAAVATAVLAGCYGKIEDDKDIDKAWTGHGLDCCTKVVEIKGHEYIIMDGPYSGCIIHAASCQCMSK